MKFRRLDLNLLVALEALLDECSVTRAADRVHLSQAAMSNALTRLREYFDDDLLVRVGRRMVMTDRARAMHSEVSEILRRIETRVMASQDFDPTEQEREVRCMMSDVMAKTFFTDLTRHIARQAPLITLSSRPIEDPPHLQLEQGRVDFLMMPRQYASSAHPMIELYREGFECVMEPDNPLLQKDFTRDAYLAATHVVIELGSARKISADRATIEQRYGPLKVGAKVYSQSMVPWMVRDTNWIGTLPASLARNYARALGLVSVALPIEVLPNVLVLQWGHFADQDACLAWLRSEISNFAVGSGLRAAA
ncbi:Nodulation protein D 2 [Aquimixticola soesokkakensis]|uniref:Nodulation protein D 2 n=1 Tax=Aquimixticola soesokkakensis TaxID=1519096 RepID=A0A1Y5TBT3_9RHOB|nr:LysR family transcriptional regulator [Aquimixticola soesokkakensis]SLN60202.1 Nodulation protein D 2 [Aquimixticola soesokkakensis]